MTRPQLPLDPDPLSVEEPDSPLGRAADSAFGCGLVLILLLLAVSVGGAAPRSAHVIPAAESLRNATASGNLGLTGAPLVARLAARFDSGTGGAPQPAVAHAANPMPAPSSGSGTALFQTTATWCAPTPKLCHGWGGNARLAALPGFSGKPYTVLVSYGSRRVLVSVVSVCWCGIDLSPSAFRELAPLSKGRIVVLVEGPITLPATSTVDAP